MRRAEREDDAAVRVETEPMGTLEQIDERLQSSMPNEDDVENFADFFMRGSDNLKKFAAEFDDIGNQFRNRVGSPLERSPEPAQDAAAMKREDELAEILNRKTTTAIGKYSVLRPGQSVPGSGVNREASKPLRGMPPRKSTKIGDQMIV